MSNFMRTILQGRTVNAGITALKLNQELAVLDISWLNKIQVRANVSINTILIYHFQSHSGTMSGVAIIKAATSEVAIIIAASSGVAIITAATSEVAIIIAATSGVAIIIAATSRVAIIIAATAVGWQLS